MLEKIFQAKLIRKIKREFPDCVVLKTDPNYIQGFPDLLILHKKRWAALEVKRSADAHHQPNQDFYINKLGKMSYAKFIFPENEKEIFHGLQQALEPRRSARISKPK